jgi:hypothetical protein
MQSYRLREYVVQTPKGDGIDRLEAGGWVNLSVKLAGIRFPAGCWHELEAGKYHATPISMRKFCATIALLGVPIGGTRDVVIGSERFGAQVHERPPVTDSEREVICGQFARHFRR